jgi:hypothetical protein
VTSQFLPPVVAVLFFLYIQDKSYASSKDSWQINPACPGTLFEDPGQDSQQLISPIQAALAFQQLTFQYLCKDSV